MVINSAGHHPITLSVYAMMDDSLFSGQRWSNTLFISSLWNSEIRKWIIQLFGVLNRLFLNACFWYPPFFIAIVLLFLNESFVVILFVVIELSIHIFFSIFKLVSFLTKMLLKNNNNKKNYYFSSFFFSNKNSFILTSLK